MSDEFSSALAKMRADFVEELPGRCALLEDSVMALEKGATDAFDELFRQVHSLKGSGGTFGLQIISSICHDLETFITRERAHFGSNAANFSLSYIDLLRRASGSEGPEAMRGDRLKQQLERLSAECMPRRSKVLLVEPSATGRKILAAQFAALPVDLSILEKGFYALSRLEAEPFDLFICSGEMPDISVAELITMLRGSEGANAHIPVIVITSNPFADPARLGIRAVVRRDTALADNLTRYTGKLLGWK